MSFHILIVDDSQTIRRSAELFLAAHPWATIEMAEDGLQALEKCMKSTFDLVLLDVMMPKLSGLETCQLLKKRPSLRQTPIVMLSSKDSLFDMARAVIAGSCDYLPKPFNKDSLCAMVTKHADKRGVSTAVPFPTAAVICPPALEPTAPKSPVPSNDALGTTTKRPLITAFETLDFSFIDQ